MDNLGISHIFIAQAKAINMCMSELQTGQQEIFDYVKNNLGEGMIVVELDPKHYQTALERAVINLDRDHQMLSKNLMLF